MHTNVQTDEIIPNDIPTNLIRGNEKGTCFLLHFAIIWDSVIFTFFFKRINHHSINRWQYVTEQRKVSCVLCRIKNLRSSCWWCCSSAQLRIPYCCHLHHTLCRKTTWFAVWNTSTSATDNSHQGKLSWYHHHLQNEMCNRNRLLGYTGLLSVLLLLLLYFPRFFVIKTVFSSLIIFQRA
jgi:hypothetical protein